MAILDFRKLYKKSSDPYICALVDYVIPFAVSACLLVGGPYDKIVLNFAGKGNDNEENQDLK